VSVDSYEFQDQEATLIQALPAEFQKFIRDYAWEQGHAHGYEEVLIHVASLRDALLPAIKAFKARLEA